MKKIKILLTTFASIFILSINFTANAADCSMYKKLSHKYNMCKIGQLKNIGENGVESGAVENTSKKSLWQKIRTFGGKTKGQDE